VQIVVDVVSAAAAGTLGATCYLAYITHDN